MLAYDSHKQEVDLTYSFTSNNATQCNLTSANTPSGFESINQIATKDGNTFNITIDGDSLNSSGTYCFNLVCTDGTSFETGNFCRNITPSGIEGSVYSSIVYGILIFTFLIFFLGSISWFNSLQWEHFKDNEGSIVQVSEDRVKKTILFFCAYVSLLLVFFFMRVMTYSVMITNNTTEIINALWLIFLVGLAPITLAVVVIAVITTITDNKLQKALIRNF